MTWIYQDQAWIFHWEQYQKIQTQQKHKSELTPLKAGPDLNRLGKFFVCENAFQKKHKDKQNQNDTLEN